MDRTEATQALAKMLAYLACGKMGEARSWAARLVDMMAAADLFPARTATIMDLMHHTEGN